jgi:23S rRNA (guanosine2251-2'-O)-methyltransferase
MSLKKVPKRVFLEIVKAWNFSISGVGFCDSVPAMSDELLQVNENMNVAPEIAVLLPDIRSAHNVGAIFRTADAAGVGKIYLSGYTPTPIDRFGRTSKEIGKTALGGELSIEWKYQKSPTTLIATLKQVGWHIVGVEQNERALDYRAFKASGNTLVIMGNEVEGISKSVLDLCDTILEIPMHGAKESLNVSVAAGIILFSLL